MRSFDEENKDSSSINKKDNKDKMVSGSSVSNSRKYDSRSKMTSGSKDLCGNATEKKNQESGKTKRKDATFIVLQKKRKFNTLQVRENGIRARQVDVSHSPHKWIQKSQEDFYVFSKATRFVRVGWYKQTTVCHSSIEKEVISLDAGLRLDGIRTSTGQNDAATQRGNNTCQRTTV